MKHRLATVLVIAAVLIGLMLSQGPSTVAQADLSALDITGTPMFLPMLRRDPTFTPTVTPSPTNTPPFACPTTSNNTYEAGVAFQAETDNPIRLASQNGDKNLELRGYSLNTNNVSKFPNNYGQDDPKGPPQLMGLFNPPRSPFPFPNVYTGNYWLWEKSPNPGTRGGPIPDWDGVTLAGMATTQGEPIHVPDAPGYNIGGIPTQYEVLVIYAAQMRITFVYFREDIINNGYAIHIENICVDPNLLALYNSLDGGARYVVGSGQYNLPNLPVGKPLGVAYGNEIIVAIRDRGAFMDPRSCEWWWNVSAGGVTCTPP